jgi:hypothetical protein
MECSGSSDSSALWITCLRNGFQTEIGRFVEHGETFAMAWREVSHERGLKRIKPTLTALFVESEVRGAFINSLRTDVVNPLQDLKVPSPWRYHPP